MSVYESVKRASLAVKRKLFDYNISIVGREVKAIRIHQEEDIFHDFSEPNILKAEPIIISIDFPMEIPLDRYRLNGKIQNTETRTYFYDILPIEIYVKLEDHMAKNDFIFFFMEDDQLNKIPFLFQITDAFGKFEIGMVWKKFYVAPYNGSDIEKLIPYLENYVISKEFDKFKEENPDSNYLMTKEDHEDYLHEKYVNLFVNPLTPREQNITFDSSIVIQCAFGSIDVEGYREATPAEPLRIIPDGETTVKLTPSEDCKFPSVYDSEFFHPFTTDKKTAYAFEDDFTENFQATFKLDFSFMKHNGHYPVVYIDEEDTYIQGFFLILKDYTHQEYRPIFYVEEGNHFILLYVTEHDYDLILIDKTTETTHEYNLGNVKFEDEASFSFQVENDNITISVLGNSQTIEGIDQFYSRKFYLGYEPERYLNDFIRQIYL